MAHSTLLRVSSHAIGRLLTCENSPAEHVSCSSACASQSRTLVKSGLYGIVRERGWRHSSTRTPNRKGKVIVFASADENNDSATGPEGGSSTSEGDVEALESRLGLGRRARRDGGESKPKSQSSPISQPPKSEKKWEEMSLVEQAWSLYIGEKGFLFWLNKLAYASIFGLIGGWIVFRFIGPALGWYQLDSPLLPPDQLLG